MTVETDIQAIVKRDLADPHRCSAPTRQRRRRRARVPPGRRSASSRGPPTASRSSSRSVHPAGVFEGVARGRDAAAALRARGRLRATGTPSRCATRTRSCRRSASSTCTSPARAATRSSTTCSARTCASSTASPARLRGVGAGGAVGERRRRLQLLGRPPAPDALAGLVGHLGAVRPRRRPRRALQVRDPHAGRRARAEGRPVRVRGRGAAADRLGRQPPGHEWADDAWLERRARPSRCAGRCRSTRSTSARGGGTRWSATAR